MAFGKGIVSALRNAFSYAVHGETKDDRDRKAGVAQTLIEFSQPVTGQANEDDLRAAFMGTQTKALEALLGQKIAVGFDTRLAAQTLGPRDNAIEGIFYPAAQSGAEGGLVSLRNDGDKQELAKQNAALLERLVRLLKDVKPAVNVYAYTTTSVAIGGEGMAAVTQFTEWASEGNDKAPAALKNPALKAPPVKAAGAPKPN